MPKFIDLTGLRVGMLTVIERGEDKIAGIPRWRCRCDCGKETLSWAQSLRSGKITSCGCERDKDREERLTKALTTHGMSATRVYKIWKSMRNRCHKPRDNCYWRYGAKGIKVCDRWRETFENFYADMGEPPTAKHTIDRINNSKGYEPGNCRWATMERQQNNRTNNRLLTIDGETKTIADWARVSGIKPATIGARINVYGMAAQAAVFKPVGGPRRRRS